MIRALLLGSRAALALKAEFHTLVLENSCGVELEPAVPGPGDVLETVEVLAALALGDGGEPDPLGWPGPFVGRPPDTDGPGAGFCAARLITTRRCSRRRLRWPLACRARRARGQAALLV